MENIEGSENYDKMWSGFSEGEKLVCMTLALSSWDTGVGWDFFEGTKCDVESVKKLIDQEIIEKGDFIKTNGISAQSKASNNRMRYRSKDPKFKNHLISEAEKGSK